MAKKAPKKTVKSKVKVAPKKPAPKKNVPVKKAVAKKALPKKPLSKARAVVSKKIAPAKKAVAKKPTKPVSKKVTSTKKIVKKVAPKVSTKKVAPTKSAKKMPTKAVSKSKVAPKKPAKVSKSLQRDIKRRNAVNAKAQPKKISSKAQTKSSSKKVVSNAKKDKKVSKSAPKQAAKKLAKPAPKQTVKKSVKSSSAKVQPKKPVSTKKETSKKAELKKTEPKKPEPKKLKKTVSKKVKKASPQKESVKQDKPVSKKSAEKKVDAPKKEIVVEPKEEVNIVPTSSGRFRIRSSHNIYFSIEDLNAYFEKRATMASTTQREKVVSKAKTTPVAVKPVVAPVPRPPLAVATVFDILGINSNSVVAKTHDKLEEQDVPRKWKKYYKMLVDLRKHHSSGVEIRSEEVLKRSAKDDAGDLSSYGQHLADAGSESFERDIAYNIISNQKEILSEIDEAIKRIKNGTYGICEITGKPIPESRLLSIPYTRCTLEGQQIKEAEIKRQKASQRASLYDISDSPQSDSPSDEDSVL